MESDHNLGFGEVSDLSGTKRVSEGSSGNSDTLNKKPRVSEKLNDDNQEGNKEEEPPLKLENVSIMDDNGVDECNQIGHGFDLNDPVKELIIISSDDEKVDTMLGKESASRLDLQLRTGGNGSGSVSVEKGCTKEQKGKAKVDDFLSLSLPSEIQQAGVTLNPESVTVHHRYPSIEIPAEVVTRLHQTAKERKKMEREARKRENRMLRIMMHYDRLNRKKQKAKNSPKEVDVQLEIFSGSFSAELKAIINRNINRKAEMLTEWSARRPDFPHRNVPSLLDISLNVLSNNPDAISSLEYVPDWLRRRLVNLLCDARKMDIRILEMLFEGSPTEIRVKNCSWMTEKQLVDMIEKSDLQNLRVLQLDSCGQCSFDEIVCNSLALSPNSLAYLGILSLRAAARLSDSTLKRLIMSAPFIQSINLGECNLLTVEGLYILSNYLKTNLKELYIDHCRGINARRSLPSIISFKHLELLSVAKIPTVNDEFVKHITAACGKTLKELNLAGCAKLTDKSLQDIGNFCVVLCSLNISNLNKLTDLGLCYLADGCRSLESLDITRAKFSDEVVAAFLETSGRSLKQLSLNCVRKVSFNSAFALAKFSRKLVSLDLSWCRKVTDEALGFITDNCLSLKLLIIFGCTQITYRFVRGRSNSQVHVVGRSSGSVLDHVEMFEPVEVLLRYSPLETPALLHNDGM